MSGYFEVVAQTSKIPGTCHGIFTQANPGYPIQKDEQVIFRYNNGVLVPYLWNSKDVEILTGHYTKAGGGIPAGLEFTSWAAFPVNESWNARQVC